MLSKNKKSDDVRVVSGILRKISHVCLTVVVNLLHVSVMSSIFYKYFKTINCNILGTIAHINVSGISNKMSVASAIADQAFVLFLSDNFQILSCIIACLEVILP